MVALAEGPNGAFARSLVAISSHIRERIASHRLYQRMAVGQLPMHCIHGYLGEMVPWFRGTMDRAIVRAQGSPYGAVKRTWLSWACEEYGHAEMLLAVIGMTGGDPDRWERHEPVYESEALMSYMWKLAVRGTYLENAAGAFLGTEGLLQVTLPKFGTLLREHYKAPPEAMQVFAEHQEADSGHFGHGLRIIAAAPKLSEDEEQGIERALRTTLLFQERWHDGILREYAT
jgi:pyrroloquinoline quinone (PQQ) biosynthesis protein C